MSPDLILDNLLSPPILFFFLGAAATIARSDLEIPDSISKLFSLYLLWAIGMKGGVALRETGLDAAALSPLLAGLAFACVAPALAVPLLRLRFDLDNACAIAASYGSVSVVTFITAANFLDQRAIEYGGQMVAALALMEAPPIIVVLILHQVLERADDTHLDLKKTVRSAFTSGPVFLLLGSLAAGALTGRENFEPLRAFTFDVFHGVLVLFLLDAGMSAARRLGDLRRAGPWAIGFGLTMPVLGAALAIPVAALLGLSVGDALLFTILAASASYIAVPAAMRLAIPAANPGLYLPMALAVTFPFNVCLGIPLYLLVIQALWA
jgi:hypothetical protein